MWLVGQPDQEVANAIDPERKFVSIGHFAYLLSQPESPAHGQPVGIIPNNRNLSRRGSGRRDRADHARLVSPTLELGHDEAMV